MDYPQLNKKLIRLIHKVKELETKQTNTKQYLRYQNLRKRLEYSRKKVYKKYLTEVYSYEILD